MYYLIWSNYDGVYIENFDDKQALNARCNEIRGMDYGSVIIGCFYGERFNVEN